MNKDTRPNVFIPLDSFTENMKELDALRAIYSHIADNPLFDPEGSKKEPFDIEILIKNGIVFIVTCWDEFIRQIVTESFDFMIKNAFEPDTFSTQVKMIASENLRPPKPSSDDNDKEQKKKFNARENWHEERWKKDIWQLAGDGWKDILKKNKDEVLKRYINRFNTPRPEIIDKLFLHVIGLQDLSCKWEWKNMTVENSKTCLNILINLRGDIVHRNNPHRKVSIDDIDYFSLFVKNLAGISANVAREYIYAKTGKYPWSKNNICGDKYNEKHCK